MAMKINKGDRVVVLSGKDKGKHGEVTKSMPKEGKVIVAGVNVVRPRLRLRALHVDPGSSLARVCRQDPSRPRRPGLRPVMVSPSGRPP